MKFYKSVQGLTYNTIERTVKKISLKIKGMIDENSILTLQNYKKEIIKKQQLLEFYTSEETLDTVGGLQRLKSWLNERKHAWEKEAQDFGIEQPSGLIEHPKLSDFFSVKRGIATGNNKFFILSLQEIRQKCLPISQFRPVLPSPRYLLGTTEINSDANGYPGTGSV